MEVLYLYNDNNRFRLADTRNFNDHSVFINSNENPITPKVCSHRTAIQDHDGIHFWILTLNYSLCLVATFPNKLWP